MIFSYTQKQTGLLSQRDEKLGAFIKQHGTINRTVFGDFFEGLCYNIVSQQLSTAACNTLWGKVCTELGSITAESCADAERLRAAGLSRSKAECIASCAEKFSTGELSAAALQCLCDEEVTCTLTRIKGIGTWTAEMTLIFCLHREDVLSLSDYGIRKGLSLLHGIDISDKAAMQRYKQLYSPYGTVASFYLWEAARELSK